MITANYADHQTPQFRVLSEGQCRELYLAALECLQRTGVEVNNAEARDLLARAGADVDGKRVRLPAHLVRQALATTPRSFTLWGRDYTRSIQVCLDKVHFGPGLTATNFVDPVTGERRQARRGDPGMVARVCDGLEHIDYVMGLGLIGDVTPGLIASYEFAELLANTTKPIVAWAFNLESLCAIYEMALAVAGSESALRRRPLFAFFGTYQSPLVHTDEDLANLMWAAGRSIPVVYLGGPTLGLSSPPTGASALVIYLATVLSGLTIIQLRQPGAPMVLGGVPAPMDLRNARVAYGAPETSLYVAAACELSRYLGVPFMGTAGASESKSLDAQAALESAIQLLMSGLSGASLVHDIGFLDCADLGSLPLLVLADEAIGMVKRLMRGIAVNADTLMLDFIDQIGPGGNFVAEERAAALCRQEIWVPKVLDRDAYGVWQQRGAKTLEERVQVRLQRLLTKHQPAPLAPAVQEKIEALLAAADA